MFDFEDISVMKPVDKKVTDELFVGLSKEGKGRAAYLNLRKNQGSVLISN